MTSPLEAVLEETFEEASLIQIHISRGGVSATTDGSHGFMAYEDVEEYGIVQAVYDALDEALSGLRDSRSTKVALRDLYRPRREG